MMAKRSESDHGPSLVFELGKELNGIEETRHIEFKEVKGPNPLGSIVNASDEYAVAFLNSEGGRIFWGVRDTPHIVVGVKLTTKDRNRLRHDMVSKLLGIQPQLDPSRFIILIHQVVGGDRELAIVELKVPGAISSKPYYTASGECYVRLDGVKSKLCGQPLTDWILRRSSVIESSALDASCLTLVKRLKSIFSGHGLQPSHLSRFFALAGARFTIAMSDLQNDATFFRWLDESKISWIADTFSIRREWIDGEDCRVQEELEYDKRPREFFAVVSKYVDGLVFANVHASPEAYFIRWGLGSDWKSKGETRVVVVIRVPIVRLSNELTIYKYLTDFAFYPWEPGRTNIQLRAWARLLFVNKRIPCFGREVSIKAGEQIENNEVFLHELIENPSVVKRVDWSPEDYSLYPSESVVAKDIATLPEVIRYLKEHNLPYEETRLSPN